MITESDFYDLNALESKLSNLELLLQLSLNIETLTNLLIQKGVFTENDLEAVKRYLLVSSDYGKKAEQIKAAKDKAEYYKTHPQEYLSLLMILKMEGKIK